MNVERRWDVVCLGHAALDRVYQVDALPRAATKLRARAYREVGGGMAANAACAIARLGGRVAFWGRAADDAAGRRMAEEFDAYGVDASAFRLFPDRVSSQSTVIVDARGERLVVNFPGDVPVDDTGWLPLSTIGSAGAVLVDVRWLEGALAIAQAAHRAGVAVVLDADVGDADVIERLLRVASHAVFSEHGLHAWSGDERVLHDATIRDLALERAYRRQEAPGARACAVTCGEHGSWWFDGEGLRHVAAPVVEAVDTLSAGDVFHGAYALAIAEGRSVDEAARFASCAAALKCTHLGGRAGSPTRAEVEAFAKAQRYRI